MLLFEQWRAKRFWLGKLAGALFCCGMFFGVSCLAKDSSVSNLVAQAEHEQNSGDTPAALKTYLEADHLSPNNSVVLCGLARQYCDLMPATKGETAKKHLIAQALDCSLRAIKADPKSPEALVSAAICYAKSFPFLDNQTKVNYSRLIKSDSEKAIALDPKFDLAYHMLGRWEFEVSNMNFIVRGLVRIAYGGLPKASKELSIQDFKKAIELNPGRIINHLQLARLYHVTGQENLVGPELQKCVTLKALNLDDQRAQRMAKKILGGEKWPEDF
jgi:tetratricopeptide (TPR) repeat protein